MPCIPHDHLLRVEEIQRILTLFAQAGVKKLRITGGEPLVSKMLFPLLEAIRPLGFQDISLTTNGQLLPQLAPALKEAGVKRVNISLDTLNPRRFQEITRGGKIEPTLLGIEAALAAGLNPVKLNIVAVRGFNDDEFLDLALLAKHAPLHIRFIELMPIGSNGFWTEKHFISAEEIQERLASLGPLKLACVYGNGPARVFRPEGFTGTLGFISAISNHFCDSCNRLRLTSDGRLYPCLHHGEYHDFFPLLRKNAPDEEIMTLMQKAVREKPSCHAFGTQKRDMSSIGG